jgi:Fic family protein
MDFTMGDESRSLEPPPQETTMHDDPTELILLLLREGSTEHAIELYSEVTGASREQARRHIDELARRAGLKSVRRRWRALALLAGGALIISLLLL